MTENTTENKRFHLIELFFDPGKRVLNIIKENSPPPLIGIAEIVGGSLAVAFGPTLMKIAGLAAIVHGSTVFQVEYVDEEV